MVKFKICGLMREQDAEYVNAVQPDYAGMIFAPNRRRTVTRETAQAIRSRLDRRIPAVGVFVGAEIEEIRSLVQADIIQLVQLHGQEDAAYLSALRKAVDVPVIQAFRIDFAEDLARAVQSQADYILLDSGNGGTGESFDWSLVREIGRPFFLAGGLTPEKVPEAVKLNPYCLDVSSGVETDGQKDPAKILAFAEAVRSGAGNS